MASLKETTEKISKICDVYTEIYKFQKTDDWLLLKLQEELGEMTAAHLKLTGQGRMGNHTTESLKENLSDEIADVLAFVLLFAENKGIDIEQALEKKWYKYIKK